MTNLNPKRPKSSSSAGGGDGDGEMSTEVEELLLGQFSVNDKPTAQHVRALALKTGLGEARIREFFLRMRMQVHGFTSSQFHMHLGSYAVTWVHIFTGLQEPGFACFSCVPSHLISNRASGRPRSANSSCGGACRYLGSYVHRFTGSQVPRFACRYLGLQVHMVTGSQVLRLACRYLGSQVHIFTGSQVPGFACCFLCSIPSRLEPATCSVSSCLSLGNQASNKYLPYHPPLPYLI
jgi:hypothetical protein